MSTIYHAKYFANELCKDKRADSSDRFSTSLFDATVDLNPHQIDAAMFAIRSPLSMGAILADEVGLGKTIEAGLVLCQYWAERKRRLLVICPASLRKQWSLELQEKFNLPAVVLDSPLLKQKAQSTAENAFTTNAITVCSYNFANRFRSDIKAFQWDLVVLDEAHKLRNAYQPKNRIGRNLQWALNERKKILLTATPLQNSLMELFGLVSIVDEHLFGDVKSFRNQYLRRESDLQDLRARLGQICKRTLRNQVTEYVRYTERKAITRPFRPTDSEHDFYEAITRFLEREDTLSIPRQQRHLTELILRKLLASSSHAIAGTLSTLKERLRKRLVGEPTTTRLVEDLIIEEEIENDYLDEAKADWGVLTPLFDSGESDLLEVEVVDDESDAEAGAEPEVLEGVDGALDLAEDTSQIDRAAVESEIKELTGFIEWAKGFGIDTKSRALLQALEIGFREMNKNKAQKRAVIFTESRRTQVYLHKFLESNGYASKVILFNGTNTEPESKVIYDQWKESNASTGRITGSKSVDIKTALIDHFRDHGEILLATEAAAEGINLQFCSLVINYDLPWNPQRIEQRIGRCHRYGQKHDVVVINFLNERNAADQRVLELLEEKFNLFNGVFGASDEVLGALESGLDFEKRVFQIYKQCRTPEEIDKAFSVLQTEMDESIKKRLFDTRRTLIEHFDDDVHARLRMQLDNTRSLLDQISRMFWELSSVILKDYAEFEDADFKMRLHKSPHSSINPGEYKLISKSNQNVPGEFLYRLSHPLGQYVLEQGLLLNCPFAILEFDISSHPVRITDVERLKGSSGWLNLQLLSIDSIEREQHLLFTGITNDGAVLDSETCEKLFRCNAKVSRKESDDVPEPLLQRAAQGAELAIKRSFEANNAMLKQEREKLERWAEDKILGAEQELNDIKSRIRALNRQARQVESPEELHSVQLKIKDLEKLKRKKRQNIFDAEDEIFVLRDELIDKLEKRLTQQTKTETLFRIQWAVV